MVTCPFEARADRDLPTWRQPNAAMAHNPSQPREFPFAPKMAARVFARKRRFGSRFSGSVFLRRCKLFKKRVLNLSSVGDILDLIQVC